MYCWHRCMSLADHQATPAECKAKGNLKLQCVDASDQIWPGTDGQFFPSCTNTTKTHPAASAGSGGGSTHQHGGAQTDNKLDGGNGGATLSLGAASGTMFAIMLLLD